MFFKQALAATALSFAFAATSVMPAEAEMSITSVKGLRRCGNESMKTTITLSGVPEGTKKFTARMVDFNASHYNHGSGTVDAKGRTISVTFKPPCPQGGTHNYQISVTATGGKKKETATYEFTK